MASTYTPFDPHEYEMRSAVLTTQRNSHSVNITSTMVELIIFEHLERGYLTGSVSYTDTGRSIEIMDFQGTEFLDVEIALHTSVHSVKKKFVIREVQSIVPTSDTTDMVTLAIIDYDAYLSSLINVNKMYEGKPSQIINDILRDSYGSQKGALRAGNSGILSEQNWDLSSEIPEAAGNAITKATSYELQSSFRYLVPNLHPLEAVEVIKRRTTGLTGTPFFCFASLADNNLRFFDLYTLLQQSPINIKDPYVFSSQLSQRAGTTGSDLGRQITSLKSPKNANTLALVMNGDVSSIYEFVDTTHGLEFTFKYDLDKVLKNLLVTNSYPAADTRTKFKGKHISEFGSKRVHKIGTANIYDNDIKNIYEETSAQKHSAMAISKSVRNLLGKSILEITVPGLHNMPQNGHKTIGRVISVLSIADVEQHTELFDRKRTGDYLIYSAKHVFTKERYSTGLSLVKIANYRGNTRVSSGGTV